MLGVTDPRVRHWGPIQVAHSIESRPPIDNQVIRHGVVIEDRCLAENRTHSWWRHVVKVRCSVKETIPGNERVPARVQAEVKARVHRRVAINQPETGDVVRAGR